MIMANIRRLPVVVVLGATGTGKSKLAIELGQRFRGEIISADSMQMYKGLDIITNKVTAEEQAQCPHHLLNMLNPLSANNTVVDFKNMALPIVEKLLDENKLPVIVGGTNYYIEALLWNFLIDEQTVELARQANRAEEVTFEHASNATAASRPNAHAAQTTPEKDDKKVISSDSISLFISQQSAGEETRAEANADGDSASLSSDSDYDGGSGEKGGECVQASKNQSSKARQEKEGQYAEFDSADLHSLLQKVDPEAARRLHPKNRRKVVRALQVYNKYGVTMSQIHQTQHSLGNTPGLSGALRFPHYCVFWLQSQLKVLDERLDKRVEDMLDSGLVSELHSLHSHYLHSVAAQNGEPDYTLGIFQSIGFKEFHDYLVLPADKRDTPEGKELFQKGVQELKLATRQYARRQLKWIKNRFLKRAGVQVPAVYSLDSTDPSHWSTDVFQPAVDILTAVITGSKVPVEPMSLDADAVPGTVHVNNVCEVCGGRMFTTLLDWQAHLGSRKHKKMLQYRCRKEKAEQQRQQMPETAEDSSNS